MRPMGRTPEKEAVLRRKRHRIHVKDDEVQLRIFPCDLLHKRFLSVGRGFSSSPLLHILSRDRTLDIRLFSRHLQLHNP